MYIQILEYMLEVSDFFLIFPEVLYLIGYLEF